MNTAQIEAFCTSGTSPTPCSDFTLTGPAEAPVVLVLGGISAQPDLSWWSEQVGSRRPIDTDRTRVLSVRFDASSTRAQAERICILLDQLGIESLACAIGCSYGGMVCLALAELAPTRVRQLVVIAAAHRPHPLATSWRTLQRRIVALGQRAGDAQAGVALARALAMTTYRSDRELDGRFDRSSVISWLEHHGRRYADRVSPETYARLTAAIDHHAVTPERVHTPTLLLGFDSDQLAPPWLLQECADRLAGPSELIVLSSIHGHDAFLLETAALSPLLANVWEVCA